MSKPLVSAVCVDHPTVDAVCAECGREMPDRTGIDDPVGGVISRAPLRFCSWMCYEDFWLPVSREGIIQEELAHRRAQRKEWRHAHG